MKSKIITFFSVFLLCTTGLLVNKQSNKSVNDKKNKLQLAISRLPNWTLTNTIPMDENIIKALHLDDYIFQQYSNGNSFITLYIGYYHTTKKVGAAHDPMVCFPGQGWKIHSTSNGTAQLAANTIKDFPYKTISASLGEQAEHILYWFQAYDQPASTTFEQKLLLFKKTFQNKGQDNAFVRVSMSCSVQNTPQCEQTLLRFVDDFYPVFLHYVTTP